MSILQDYTDIRKDIGEAKFDAIDSYLNEININKKEPDHNHILEDGRVINNENYIFLHDVIYNKSEFEKFEKWYEDYLFIDDLTHALNCLQTHEFINTFNDEYQVNHYYNYSRHNVQKILQNNRLLDKLINTLDFDTETFDYINHLSEINVLGFDCYDLKDKYIPKLKDFQKQLIKRKNMDFER